MMSTPFQTINEELPLLVRAIEYSEPHLSIYGDEWGLLLACPWYGTISGATINWESDALETVAWELIGQHLLRSRPRAAQNRFDPRFEFDDAFIEVFADTNDYETWVLNLPSIAIVGSMS